MAELESVVTEVLDTSFNFPHVDIYRRFYDGVQSSWRVYPHEGYIMYSQSTDIIANMNPETGEETTEIYYCRMANLSMRYNFDNFDYIAVLEGDNSNHEIM